MKGEGGKIAQRENGKNENQVFPEGKVSTDYCFEI